MLQGMVCNNGIAKGSKCELIYENPVGIKNSVEITTIKNYDFIALEWNEAKNNSHPEQMLTVFMPTEDGTRQTGGRLLNWGSNQAYLGVSSVTISGNVITMPGCNVEAYPGSSWYTTGDCYIYKVYGIKLT